MFNFISRDGSKMVVKFLSESNTFHLKLKAIKMLSLKKVFYPLQINPLSDSRIIYIFVLLLIIFILTKSQKIRRGLLIGELTVKKKFANYLVNNNFFNPTIINLVALLKKMFRHDKIPEVYLSIQRYTCTIVHECIKCLRFYQHNIKKRITRFFVTLSFS